MLLKVNIHYTIFTDKVQDKLY